jgi:hypothetical protein
MYKDASVKVEDLDEEQEILDEDCRGYHIRKGTVGAPTEILKWLA